MQIKTEELVNELNTMKSGGKTDVFVQNHIKAQEEAAKQEKGKINAEEAKLNQRRSDLIK